MSMILEEAIKHAEEVAQEKGYEYQECLAVHDMENAMDCGKCGEEHEQLAEWLKILKKAKFEYDEAWRIITHPTPDVTYADRKRAQVILDTFRNSLGRL